MKTLYIHGLDSHPVPEKLEILKKAGLEVLALHLDYRTEPNIYQTLKQYALEQEVEFLVGSSMGGLLAYWLAEDLGLPCLLFNPAMSYGETLKDFFPKDHGHQCPARFVVIGALDELVDPQENILFFRKNNNEGCYQRVLLCEWLEHQIDYDSFESMTSWALKGYELFRQKT